MSMSVITFSVPVTVTPETVQDLLICAFEGGSNYWYDDLEPLKETSTKSTPSERFYDDIVTHGFSLTDQYTGKKHEITPEKIKNGVISFYNNHPKHYADATSENADAITGDVFLQTVVFGELVYG